jgi:hypothetical protein
MPDMLKNPMLSDVLNVLHVNGIKYADSHRLIATIYRYHQLAKSTDFVYEFIKSDSFTYQ